MSFQTAADTNSPTCTDSKECPTKSEKDRLESCVTCSENIGLGTNKIHDNYILAYKHRPVLEQIIAKVTEAASNECFPPEIILGFISRLSIENNILQAGWQPCKLRTY